MLVVGVERAAVNPRLFARSDNPTVTSYYATDWNRTVFETYRRRGTVVLERSGQAVATGRYRIVDRSRGLGGGYHAHLAGLIAETVAEGFRGAVPR
ncbi:hypothetical protein BRC83_06560 [Halobacteriales archaeon QS_1_68_17]|nr:MAG: hypothetical protein BRC83_06560 [Halobacteriales archaeon QS_1_68_17]